MHIIINHTSMTPIYEQIVSQIKEDIIIGKLTPGTKIGRLAGEYILEHLYEEGDRIVVIEGVKGSPISEKRHRGILDATIQSPDFCSMAYDAALALLYGEEADHNLTIEPQLITENK